MLKRESLRQARIVMLILLGVLACLGLLSAGVDQICVNEAKLWMPRYPGASVVQEEYSLLRPFGIGITDLVLHSEDERDTVSQWYVANRRENRDQRRSRLSDMTWRTASAPNGGTFIYMHAECGQ